MEKTFVDDIYEIAKKYGFEVRRLEEYRKGEITVRFEIESDMPDKDDRDMTKCEEISTGG